MACCQSEYYKNLHDQYEEIKKNRVQLKDKYVTFRQKLSALSGLVGLVSSQMSTCNSKFSGGGYVLNGVGLYSDEISSIISTLEDNASIIDKSINFCTERIPELEKTIEDYQNKINEAWDNYVYWQAIELNLP